MKTKAWLMALVVGMSAAAAPGAALITKGVNEVAAAGKLDFGGALGTEYNLDLRYGYFVIDRLTVGTRATMANNDYTEHFGLGLLSEYNFRLPTGWKPLFGTDLVPYLGMMLDYRYSHIRNPPSGFDESGGAGVLGGEAGLKFFLTDSTALTLALIGELATSEIYEDDGEATDKELYLQLGMRFYF
jgi:hypothetical protein